MKNFALISIGAVALSLVGAAPVQAMELSDQIVSAYVDVSSEGLILSTLSSQGDANERVVLPASGAGAQTVEIAGLLGYAEYAPIGADSGSNEVVALVLPGKTLIAWVDSEVNPSISNSEGNLAVSDDLNFVTDSFEAGDPKMDEYQIEANYVADSEVTSTEFSVLPVSAIQVNSLSAQASALAAATALSSTSTFRQNSFIPSAYLGAPPLRVCTPDDRPFRFVGDNRSWSSSDSAKVRTRMDVRVNWATAPTLTLTKTVGETVREVQAADGTWSVENRATASSSSMTVTPSTLSSTLVAFTMRQDVVNPMCNGFFTNGIAATTDVQIYRSGIVSGSIAFLQMPNYELYFRQDLTAWKTVKLLPLVDVGCLTKFFGAVCNDSVPFP